MLEVICKLKSDLFKSDKLVQYWQLGLDSSHLKLRARKLFELGVTGNAFWRKKEKIDFVLNCD